MYNMFLLYTLKTRMWCDRICARLHVSVNGNLLDHTWKPLSWMNMCWVGTLRSSTLVNLFCRHVTLENSSPRWTKYLSIQGSCRLIKAQWLSNRLLPRFQGCGRSPLARPVEEKKRKENQTKTLLRCVKTDLLHNAGVGQINWQTRGNIEQPWWKLLIIFCSVEHKYNKGNYWE